VRLVALVVSAACLPIAHADAQTSFGRDVAPLVGRHCVACHRDGGDAPFALTTAGAVQSRAATVAAVVASRYMPPWKPEPGYGDFGHDLRLPEADLATITRWATEGAVIDVPSDARVPAAPESDRAPEPDVVVTLPSYRLPADGRDVFRNFVVPVPLPATRYVRGVVFRPRGRAVHHANIRVDATPASRRLDDADPAAGYEGLILKSADYPDGHFLGWTPGQVVPRLDEDLAWRLDPGTDLVVQLHLRPTGREEDVTPAIGLYFGGRPAARPPLMLRLGRQTLAIPAAAAAHRVSDAFVLPAAVEIRAVQPHAHFRAREVEAWATRPDGSRVPLLRIGDWDARWQDRYRYRTPVHLPAGTRLETTYVFDNSAANPRNPVQPPVAAEWGWRTSDEMGDVWFQMVVAGDADRARVAAAVQHKMQAEDVLGCEVLLVREPNHVPLRNDAALLYLALGRPADALRHFEAVTRLEPESAAAWFNEGVALEALGRVTEAARRYEGAVARRPAYSAALNNLGALWLRAGRVREAASMLSRAADADATNLDARANLALALALEGDTDASIAVADRLVSDAIEAAAKLAPLARLLAAHPDAEARRPSAARDLARRIVGVTRGTDAGALDALAVSLAATGQFDEAIRVAEDAVTRATASEADEIRARLALYRRRQPFVLKQ
jgi:Flp pilus assembly protein TadD